MLYLSTPQHFTERWTGYDTRHSPNRHAKTHHTTQYTATHSALGKSVAFGYLPVFARCLSVFNEQLTSSTCTHCTRGTALHSTHCTALHCTHCTVMHCTYWTALHSLLCTPIYSLHCTHCTTLHSFHCNACTHSTALHSLQWTKHGIGVRCTCKPSAFLYTNSRA